VLIPAFVPFAELPSFLAAGHDALGDGDAVKVSIIVLEDGVELEWEVAAGAKEEKEECVASFWRPQTTS